MRLPFKLQVPPLLPWNVVSNVKGGKPSPRTLQKTDLLARCFPAQSPTPLQGSRLFQISRVLSRLALPFFHSVFLSLSGVFSPPSPFFLLPIPSRDFSPRDSTVP